MRLEVAEGRRLESLIDNEGVTVMQDILWANVDDGETVGVGCIKIPPNSYTELIEMHRKAALRRAFDEWLSVL